MIDVAVVGIFLVFAATIFAIFKTKTPGYGIYNTSVLVLTLVLFVATMAFFLDKIDWQPYSNILFAIAGYVGGLLVPSQTSNGKTPPP